jgi:DNA-binding XRE family transcriptional regulator
MIPPDADECDRHARQWTIYAIALRLLADPVDSEDRAQAAEAIADAWILLADAARLHAYTQESKMARPRTRERPEQIETPPDFNPKRVAGLLRRFDELNTTLSELHPSLLNRYLAQWREHCDMSLDDLEKATGVSRSTLYCWEYGDRTVSYQSLVLLAKAYDVEVADLFSPPPDIRKSVAETARRRATS